MADRSVDSAEFRIGEPVAGIRFTQSVRDFSATVDGVCDPLVSQPVMNVWNGATSAPAVRGTGFWPRLRAGAERVELARVLRMKRSSE